MSYWPIIVLPMLKLTIERGGFPTPSVGSPTDRPPRQADICTVHERCYILFRRFSLAAGR